MCVTDNFHNFQSIVGRNKHEGDIKQLQRMSEFCTEEEGRSTAGVGRSEERGDSSPG